MLPTEQSEAVEGDGNNATMTTMGAEGTGDAAKQEGQKEAGEGDGEGSNSGNSERADEELQDGETSARPDVERKSNLS